MGNDFFFLERQKGVQSMRQGLPMALLNLLPSYSPGKDEPQDPGKQEEECQQYNYANHCTTPWTWRLPCN